jgi:hypothetical protein
MNRRILLLLSAACATPALADVPQQGQGAFAGGRGHISFETGIVEMSVEPVHADGHVWIDGTPVEFAEGVDEVDGEFYGGSLSFVLPGENDHSWFGQNLRVFFGYRHERASAAERHVGDGPTITEGIDLATVSPDGRMFASSSSHVGFGSAQVAFFAPAPSGGSTCSDTDGANSASAAYDGGVALSFFCNATPVLGIASLEVAQGGAAWAGQATGSALTGLPIPTEVTVTSSHKVADRRGEAGFAGDFDVSPSLTLSPSLSVSIGERRADFHTSVDMFDTPTLVTIRVEGDVVGTLDTRDAGLNLGLRATYQESGGFDLFASLGGAVIRRKTEMTATAPLIGGVGSYFTFTQFAVGGGTWITRTDTIAAFQAALEAGAGYTFDPAIGIGPMRLSLTGGLSYDSDVPFYGNVGAFSGPLTGPVAPAHIAYTGETTTTLRAAITFELP